MSESESPGEAIPQRIVQDGYMAAKRCKHGTFVYNVNDLFVGRSLDLYGEWCESELEVLKQLLRPGGTVLDVGANIGTHTVFFAKQVADGGVVYAFEPQRLAFQNLCANLAINALVNVVARPVGIGSERTTVHLPTLDPRREMNFAAFPMAGHEVGEMVEVIPIDELDLPRCHLIKVDVEGMECDVLKGAQGTIERLQPILYVENNTIDRSAQTIESVESLGYEAYWHIIRLPAHSRARLGACSGCAFGFDMSC